MTLEEMQERKRELGYSNEVIAEKSGVPLGTVQKIFGGLTKAPRQRTIEALEYVLSKRPELLNAYGGEVIYRAEEGGAPALREGAPALAFPRRGPYTIDDYYAMPDERRVELIDGVFYDMAAPTKVHQLTLLQMALQLYPCVAEHPGCQLYMAPLDVRLDNDNYTMVQPDLLIVCDESDGDKRRVNGAPDFAAEILSPSNRDHDMLLKYYKYREAGVREYWIVDPERKKIAVYDFESGELPESYTFDDTVPLRISEGKCSMDFSVISKALSRFD